MGNTSIRVEFILRTEIYMTKATEIYYDVKE